MTGILITKVSTPIIGQAAWLLGKLMDILYQLMSMIGIKNVGICIMLLTVVVYTLMYPLTVKQQKFSKMSSAMGPEIQKIQKKYQGKRDNESIQKMNEETQLVYEKYGVSPMSGCSSLLIQLPILYAIWYVIRGIPAYIGQVKEIYLPLVDGILSTKGGQAALEAIGAAKPVLMSPEKYDYSQSNIIIDALYKFETSTWESLKEAIPSLESLIDSTMSEVQDISYFLGLNIAESPATLIKSGLAAGAWAIVIMAVLIPLLSGLTQFISVKMMPQNTNGTQTDAQVAATMKTMNYTMPLLSVFMCFTLPTGLGIYWITSAVVRTIQQLIVSKQLSKIDMDELVQKNLEKAEAKRAKQKAATTESVNNMAHTKTKKMDNVKSKNEQEALEKKIENVRKQNANAKEGSLASKADLVRKFNDGNK